MLTALSCNNDNFEQEILPADSGAVRLSIATPKSVAIEEYNPTDFGSVKIYKYTNTTNDEGEDVRLKELIRHYKSLDAMPTQLALLAGDYAVKVEVGSKAEASFTELSYRGEADFTIEAGIISTVQVECKLLNSLVQVVFENSVAQKLDAEYYTNICIGESYDASKVAAGKVSFLRYDESGTGYFLMPENQKSLSWFFHGKSSDAEIGTVEKTGLIENVAAATKYTLTFKYSKGLGGTLTFEVDVDTTEEIVNDKIAFSPDPTVKGAGFDPAQIQYVLADNYTFNVAALATINLMTVSVEGTTYDLKNGSTAGVSVTSSDDKHYDITFSPAFFAEMAGGAHTLTFKVTDQDGGEANVPVEFCTQGIAPLGNNYDLWFNTANFSGVAFDPAATSVVVKYRTVGGDWKELAAATTSTANTYAAQANDFAAGKQYEYALFVNNNQVGNILSVTTPAGAQIPNGDFENWTKKNNTIWCPAANLSSAIWDTGNHAIGSYSSLIGQDNISYPKDDVRPGSTGSKSAYMESINAVIALAAGNLFIGQFIQTERTGGIVDFGKPFEYTARPKAVKFWMKNNCGIIDKEGDLKLKGESDLTKIFICLCDRTEPYRVNTNNKETLFDPNTAANVIANGIYESTTSVPEWTEITIPIVYKDNNTKPNFLVFTFTCSGYGDYFTGSTDSFMYIDDIELVY